jgi:enamine deaminase RidA (YjgF/YER057c/UK114 family)
MDGLNMLTSVVMAIDPALERRVAVPAPHRGRASRCTRVGPFTFVIGVRGSSSPKNPAPPPEENAESFDVQLNYAYDTLEGHLAHDGNTSENFLRVDTTLRAARFVSRFENLTRDRFNGRIPFASFAIGTPLGGHNEQELGGVAIVPGEEKTVYWSAGGTRADATAGGGLVFLRSVSGVFDERAQHTILHVFGDVRTQAAQCIRNIETLLERTGSSLDHVLRLDVFLRDIYAQDEVIEVLRGSFGAGGPVMSFIGCEPRNLAEVEIIAIAGAA